MTRPAARRPAACLGACLAAGLLTLLLAPFTPSAGADELSADEAPLQVSIDTLTPSTIPGRGKVTVTGTITNRSDSTWSAMNVYLLTSADPIRTSAELAEASATDPTAVVGARLTDSGLYDEVGDLAPGSSTDYVLSVARKDLEISGEPGVYWLGVHVLGTNEDGHDSVADGRARSFLPLMRPRGPQTTMSLVVPIQGQVRRDTDGSLTNPTAWQHLLAPDGRLGRLLQMSASSTQMPATWVVDPAVIDAARSVAADNPPMSAGPTTDGAGGTDATSSPSPSSSSSPPDDPTEEAPPAESPEGALEATQWLDQFRRQAGQRTVLTVPYGDLDVASVLRGDSAELYAQATELSTETMAGLDVTTTPVVAPSSGFLPRTALNKLDAATPVLLSDRAMPSARGPVVLGPVLQGAGSAPVVLIDSSAGAGGPGPTPRFAALAVRQRVLSEAALHALSPARDQPLLVSTPQLWDPGRDWRNADFFSGLDVDWLRAVGLPSASTQQPERSDRSDSGDDTLVYPPAQRKAEVPIANLLATQELIATGHVFAGLLTLNDTVDEFLAKSGMLASSSHARSRAHAAATATRDTTDQIRFLMEKVHIDGPPFVTMSSEQGTLGVVIINDLPEPVTVGIRADTGGNDLVIHSPETVEIGPGQRTAIRLRATSNNIGVYSVTLVPTNADGAPLGNETRFSVRSSQVGLVIWVIMGIGAAVLFITAGIRIVRRILNRKATDVRVPEGEES